MCLVKLCLNVVAFVSNIVLGAWALTFPDEYQLFSLVFFIPAFTGLTLTLAPAGSRIACMASALVLLLATAKLIFSIVCAVFASEASRSNTTAGGLGVLVFAFLAILSGISAVSDLVIGCTGYSKWRKRRDWSQSLELAPYGA